MPSLFFTFDESYRVCLLAIRAVVLVMALFPRPNILSIALSRQARPLSFGPASHLGGGTCRYFCHGFKEMLIGQVVLH